MADWPKVPHFSEHQDSCAAEAGPRSMEIKGVA